jgi:hypothetical protein
MSGVSVAGRDRLDSLWVEATRQGDRRLAGEVSARNHAAYIDDLERRLAAIGCTFLDLLEWEWSKL